MYSAGEYWQSDSAGGAGTRGKEIVKDTMDFLSRSWSASALEVVKALSSPTSAGGQGIAAAILEDVAGCVEEEDADIITGNSFTFASPATSQLVLQKILTQSQEASQLTTGRLSHSNGPLNGGSLSDSPPVSPSDRDDFKYGGPSIPAKPVYRGGSRTMGRWLKDRKERRKEVTRAQTAHLHAAVSVAGLSAAVAAVSVATAATSSKDDSTARIKFAIASAATLIAAQCVEAAESLGAERGHIVAAVASAVSIRTPGDMATLTAAAGTALRGAATLKARVLKEMWNTTAVIPVEKGCEKNRRHWNRHSENKPAVSSSDFIPGQNFLGLCNQNLLSRGSELLKRTRKGDLHWKMVSVYIHRTAQVKLKMKSRHVAGTITKKKKHVVIEVCRDIPSWPGRHLLSSGEERRYFGLKTAEQRVIEFECKGRRSYEMWTTGVSRLLAMVGEMAWSAS
ncbi:hypothetical protein KSP39_PZI019652 [Platanthera zijinensis]|uniref:VAN3-binding protein n=1 Tax=Platanthera zijinensis TaxID=2320716 RepID=A0AAP0B1Q3_9ASPA